MRALAMLVFSFALLWGVDVEAQEALTMATPPGKPLVWDPEFVVPEHDPETHVVAFRLHSFEVDSADVPFFVDREGIIVPKAGVEAAAAVLTEDGRFVLLLCSFPSAGLYNLALPRVRLEHCALRRVERQP